MLDNQEGQSLFRPFSVKAGCPRSPRGRALGRAGKEALQAAITQHVRFLRQRTQKSCMQGEQRQKRGPCRPLHIVRPLQWETHGPPSPQRTHPVLPAPRFQNNHNPRVATILQAFITAEKCSLGALCVCLEGRVLQKRSGATV